MTGFLVALRDTALSVDEVIAAVSGAGVGGTAVFLGTVRDHDHDKQVAALEYSAHPSASAELERVVAEVGRSVPGVSLAAVHRVGSLQVGEIAVVVAAGAPHRHEAFAAARLLVDRVKAEVPLWKHQTFADGSQEWVGACDPPTA
ncbi:MAG TPA: molybdenum cofactor biosynthesis protein MoaE [Mycobacteriales bacterium]|nr:molybdenum cofactor biosynthesis protein MoaE [Mycobacteriales bacterium]